MTNAEQVVTHEQLIISYARVKTLSGKVMDQLLMSNNLLSVLFAAIFSDVLVKKNNSQKKHV